MQNEINQTESPPISADLLSSYLNGTAPEAERKQIDLLLQKDDMLQEAMEGLKQMNNPAMLLQFANEINQTIGIKSGFVIPKSKIFHISSAAIKPMMAIAASLVIVAGSFFLIKQYSGSQKELALVKNKDTVAAPTDETFEKTELFSDTLSNQLVGIKKTESNEETILNQGYINQLDSVNTGSSVALISNGTTTTTLYASNMMNPMKTMAPGGFNKIVENQSEAGDEEYNQSKNRNILLLKGQVVDNASNQPIKGASIIVDGKIVGTSNVNGFYEVSIESGKHDLVYAQSGYDEEKQQVLLNSETKKQVNVGLNQSVLANNGLVAKYENQAAKMNDQSVAGGSTIIDNIPDNNSDTKTNTDLKIGLNEYSAQNYNGAITNLSKTLAKDPNNKDALFYIAMSHYNLGNNNKAISYYSKTIANGGKYREDALWYKAQILLKQKNTEQARALLEELKDTKYSQRSVKLLDSLDK